MIQPSSATQPEIDISAQQAQRKRRVLELLRGHPFQAPWWLRGQHGQTLWSRFLRRQPPVDARRETWETPDGDFLNLHFNDGDPALPTALLLHGLEGCSRSNYMIGLARGLAAHGWNVVALDFRSCGGAMNRARRLYHSGETTDLEFVVSELIRRRPDLQLYIAGFSLGGNVTAKWLGQKGESIPCNVVAAAVVCPPFDLTVSGPQMDRAGWGLYSRWFTRSLIKKAIEKERQYPGALDLEAIEASRTFVQFDTHATAALHGYRDATDYYAQVSCGQFLHAIRRPTLLLSSADDPFNPTLTLPRKIAEESPWLHPQFTERGGHVGFVAGSTFGPFSYRSEEQVVRFFLEYAKT